MRDCEIVVIDGQRGFGNGCLLPRGPLRERPRRLRRVNAVVVNGPVTRSGFDLPRFVKGTHFVMHMRPGDAWPVRGGASLRSLSSFRGTGVHAVAAIGNPQRFFDMLREAGLTIYEHPMPDHHPFRPGDLNFGDALPILMTEKDAVKCAAFADERCWFVPVTAEFAEHETRGLIDLVLARVQASSHRGFMKWTTDCSTSSPVRSARARSSISAPRRCWCAAPSGSHFRYATACR